MKTPARLLGGLALGALVMTATALPLGTTYADEPARPLSSEQIQCYPEDVVLGWCYGFADAPDPALVAGSPLASEFVAVTPTSADRNDRGLFDEVLPEDLKQGEASSPVSVVQFEEWPEVGLDSYTYHRFMVEQGKVGKGLSRAVASPSSIDLNEVWTEIEDTPIHHLMKQLKAGSPSSIDLNEAYAEIDDVEAMVIYGYSASIFHALNQGKAGSPLASDQGACYPLYPELGPCPSEFIAVTPTIADRNDRGLFDEVLPEDLK